eukprot:7494261-Pyramimonas_sp.AAC.1
MRSTIGDRRRYANDWSVVRLYPRLLHLIGPTCENILALAASDWPAAGTPTIGPSYGNAETADLWAALEEATGEPVGRVAHNWTRLMGYPVVHASASPDGRTLSGESHNTN